MQEKGGVFEYGNQEVYTIDCICGERVGAGGREYYVRWEGYDHTYNTWEPRDNILDEGLIAFWDGCGDGVKQALWEVSELRAQGYIKVRAPAAEIKTVIPAGAAVGHELLQLWRRPPSRVGKKPLKLEVEDGATRRSTSLQLDELDDIGWVEQLQLAREGAFGCALLKKGRGSAHDMSIGGPPWVACLDEPVPAADGAFVPGRREFSITSKLWGVNGATGALKAILGEDNEYMAPEIAEYVKNILRGRARWGLKVKLSKAAFSQAGKKKLRLTKAEAFPRASIARARAGPSTCGDAPPQMGALE